jgi:versiconal hemiacetal acetate esterase
VPVINRQALEVFFTAAQVNHVDATHFVTLSDRLKEFPRTWIATCEKDPLRDDGVVLENMLRAQGVEIQRKHYKGFGHCFWIFPQLEKRRGLLADVVNGIRFVTQG